MLSLFKSKPLLEEDNAEVLLSLFIWTVENFDSNYILNNTRIVEPTSQFFPERVSSIDEMAQTVFTRVKDYAGMTKWPVELVSPQNIPSNQVLPFYQFNGGLRGDDVELSVPPPHPVVLSFNPNQVNQPQDLVASLANGLALVMLHHVEKKPPVEVDITVLADILAIVMGYGIMISNTAYHFRGSCGSCYNAYANRQAALNEDECLFIHALVCQITSGSDGASHLKSHLKSVFKKAKKQVKGMIEESADPALLAMVQGID